MLCPYMSECSEYKNKKRYRFIEKFRCSHKEYWSKCILFLEKHGEKKILKKLIVSQNGFN